MAYDTVIDKAKLEQEMTATANAIRGLNQTTDVIEWKDNTGFADTISSISANNCLFVKVGEVTITYTTSKLDIKEIFPRYAELTIDNIIIIPKSFVVFSTTEGETEGSIKCGTYSISKSYSNGVISVSRTSVPGKVGISFPSDVYVHLVN